MITTLLATLACLPRLQDAPPPAPPSVKVHLAVDRKECKAAEEVQLEIRIENTGSADQMLPVPSYEEGTISFLAKARWDSAPGEREYVLMQIRPDPHVRRQLSPIRVNVPAGKSLTCSRRIPALAPGLVTLTARYHADTHTLTSDPATVRVVPAGTGKTLIAVVATERHGSFTLELLPEQAPANVTNFVELSRRGFYDGLPVHRIVKNNWIQTGCPYGLGIGGPGYTVPSEAKPLPVPGAPIDPSQPPPAQAMHDVGTVSMAGHEKSGYHGSQFFICLTRLPSLDGRFTVIGRVSSATQDTVNSIGQLQTDKNTERPTAEVKITSITIGTQ